MNLIIIIICILLAYTYCYFVFPSDLSILQTSLDEFDFNMLHSRQPLVIQDRVMDIMTVIKAWFSPNIITENVLSDTSKIWSINDHKYCLAYALEDTELLVYPAGKQVVDDTPDNSEPVIGIKMKKFQSVIIPYKWYYSSDIKLKLYGIDDYITWVLGIII